MIVRTLTIAAFAAALGLSACPAEATGPWGIIANGTQLNGIALQGAALDGVRMRETDEDDADAVDGCGGTWMCGSNGTSFNGIALEGITLDSVRMQETDEDDGDALSGCPEWACGMNGTSLNGIALQGVTLDSIRMQETEDDDLNCEEWICGMNGTQLNGLALQGVTLDSVRMQETEEDDFYNCQSDGICPKNGTRLNGVALKGVTLEGIRIQETEGDAADRGSCPEWMCGANGTSFNGIALEGATLDRIWMREPEEDDPNCPDWLCGSNGTQLNGMMLQGVTLHSIRAHEPEEDELNCDEWICGANGTERNGMALEGISLNSIRMHEPEEDELNCDEWVCGMNGTSFNGLTLQGVTLARIRLEETEVGNADESDSKEGPSPVVQPSPTTPLPSVRDMMLQIQASPGGIQALKEAELRSAPIQSAMANFSTACEPPGCLEATPARPGIGAWGSYGFQIWGQNITWLGPQSTFGFWLTAPVLPEALRFKQGTPLLVAQSYNNSSGGWHVIAFEVCKATHEGRSYTGPVVGRLFHGVDSNFPYRKLPSDATLLNTWQLTINPDPPFSCHMFPTLVELTRGEHGFVFELEVGDLLVQRVSLRRL
jgi:uncharacterized protein YjbI with pentapeptide repeats